MTTLYRKRAAQNPLNLRSFHNDGATEQSSRMPDIAAHIVFVPLAVRSCLCAPEAVSRNREEAIVLRYVVNLASMRQTLRDASEGMGLEPQIVGQALERALIRDGTCFVAALPEEIEAATINGGEAHEARSYVRFDLGLFVADCYKDTPWRATLDWLYESKTRRARWLDKRLADGRIRRLTHICSVADLASLVARDGARWDREAEAMRTGKTEPVVTFEDGWSWVALLDAEALRHEGFRMRNCLRSTVILGMPSDRTMYSLRDASGRSRETIAVSRGIVMERRGKANSPPPMGHGAHYASLVTALDLSKSYLAGGDGTLRSGDDVITIEELTRGGTVDGSIVVRHDGMLPLLPQGLTIKGGLYLLGCGSVEALAHDLTIEQDCVISGCGFVESVARRLHVRGNLEVKNCRFLWTLGADLRVDGDLTLLDCARLYHVRAGTRIGGGLRIARCNMLRTLPHDLSVGGVTDLRESVVEIWPGSLEAGGVLEPWELDVSCGSPELTKS